MFTGIIEEVGFIEVLPYKNNKDASLRIACNKIQEDLKLGDSLAVDGVCLTITSFNKTTVTAELSPETLARTLFDQMKAGGKVNLERALQLTDRLGGHMLLGHVDALAEVLEIQETGTFHEFEFGFDPSIKRYLVHKGAVSVNGISLTISRVQEQSFCVSLIPHTMQNTSLNSLRQGDRVHLETDIIARYVEGLLADRPQKEPKKALDLAFLQKHGFDA